MYANIYGSGDAPVWVCYVIMLCMILIVVALFMIATSKTISPFANLPNDYGIGQRGDVVVATPQLEELSLRQKNDIAVAKLSAGNTSQLTGTRDIPVFFQDYDVEAVRSKNGAVSTAREGFTGKADDDLEKALAGH